jgi:O-antigen ligase
MANPTGTLQGPLAIGGAALRRGLAKSERAPIDPLQLALMLMTLVTVWRIQSLIPQLNTIKIQYLAPGLALLAFIADNDPRRAVRRVAHPLLYKLLAIALLIVASIPTSIWAGWSFRFFYNDHAKTIILTVLMAASIRSTVDIERYALVHIGGALYYSNFVLSNFRLRSGRLGDLVYYDSNDLALLIVCTIPFCVYFLRPSAKLLYRLLGAGALAYLTLTLVKTGSRGGFLGFVVCGGYLLFRFTAIPARTRALSVALLTISILAFGGSAYWEMMGTLLEPTKDYNWSGDTGRIEIWKRGVGYMLTHPITGVGARCFKCAEGASFADLQAEGIGMKWSAAHNSFVEIGAELGVIGLALFILALWQSWKMVRSIQTTAARAGPLESLGHALGGAILGYAFTGFFLAAAYSAYLYTLFAMVLGMTKLLAQQKEASAGGAADARSEPPHASLARWPGGPRPRANAYPGPAPLPHRLPPA